MRHYFSYIATAGATAMLLSACQMDEMVTSVNPIFQSEDTRALRETFNNATFIGSWQSGGQGFDFGPRVSCRSVNIYSEDGTYRSYAQCREGGSTDPLSLALSGSWNIRGDEYCENIWSVMGNPATAQQRQTRCFPASVSGNTVIKGPTTYRAVGDKRFQAI